MGVAVGAAGVAVGNAVVAGGAIVAFGVTGVAVAAGSTVVTAGVADEVTDIAVEDGAWVAVGIALTTLTGEVVGSISVGSPHAAINIAIKHPIVPSSQVQ